MTEWAIRYAEEYQIEVSSIVRSAQSPNWVLVLTLIGGRMARSA